MIAALMMAGASNTLQAQVVIENTIEENDSIDIEDFDDLDD